MADIRASVKGVDQRRRSRVLVALLLVASLAVVGVAGWYVGLWPGHRFAVADLGLLHEQVTPTRGADQHR